MYINNVYIFSSTNIGLLLKCLNIKLNISIFVPSFLHNISFKIFPEIKFVIRGKKYKRVRNIDFSKH